MMFKLVCMLRTHTAVKKCYKMFSPSPTTRGPDFCCPTRRFLGPYLSTKHICYFVENVTNFQFKMYNIQYTLDNVSNIQQSVYITFLCISILFCLTKLSLSGTDFTRGTNFQDPCKQQPPRQKRRKNNRCKPVSDYLVVSHIIF